jgi:uncharacterized protein
VWKIFRRKPRKQQKVTASRFEIERNGEVAFLEYELSENVLVLSHTEVPTDLRGKGLASSLAETALQWARQHNLKVDVVCPVAREFVTNHPEYSDLLLR